jgi:hypothetical protein
MGQSLNAGMPSTMASMASFSALLSKEIFDPWVVIRKVEDDAQLVLCELRLAHPPSLSRLPGPLLDCVIVVQAVMAAGRIVVITHLCFVDFAVPKFCLGNLSPSARRA